MTNLFNMLLGFVLLFFAGLFIPASALEEIETPLAGGWSASRIDDDQVLQAADFCLRALRSGTPDLHEQKPEYSFLASPIKSPKVVRAHHQVVAGLNFHLTIILQGSDTACLGAFTATVYNRFEDLSITNWGKEITCTEAEAMLKTENDDS